MTRLPIDGPPFDVVFLGSVFTHLYPEEVGSLLKEVSRLLDERGFVLADAFVTGDQAGYRGYRGMVRISEFVLHRLFHDAGLAATELFTTPARRCRRVMYRLHRIGGASTS